MRCINPCFTYLLTYVIQFNYNSAELLSTFENRRDAATLNVNSRFSLYTRL